MNALQHLLVYSDVLVLVYFVLLNGFYLLLLVLSIPELWRHWATYKGDELSRYLVSEALPPISVVVPAYNMEASIRDTTECLLGLRYARHEVIIVNDGSNDATLECMREAFHLYEVPAVFPTVVHSAPLRAVYRSRTRPNLLVIDKENGGKADAHNAGICAAMHPLVLFVDADTLLDPDALLRLGRIFLLDPEVVAAGATIRIANGCRIEQGRVTQARVARDPLSAIQVAEYLRAFLFGRLGFNSLGGNLIISGAFGIYRKDLLVAIEGFRTDTVAEDMDCCVRLHRYLREAGVRYSIPFVPDPIAWTEAPQDLRAIAGQRERWHRGLIAVMRDNIDVLLNPRYGWMGMVSVPFFFFGEMLAPLIELFGFVVTVLGLWLGLINLQFALALLVASWGFGMLLTVASVVMEEVTFQAYDRVRDFGRVVLAALVEPFGYRQLTVLWRTTAFWRALRGSRSWGVMTRHGFSDAEAET